VGRPVLDRGRQQLRLADVALDVESHAAFRLLDAAARAAVAVSGKNGGGQRSGRPGAVHSECTQEASKRRSWLPQECRRCRVDAAATDVRLVAVEFDAKTLRVIAEADGTVRVAVTKLPER
jgi:hypothetical protein